MVNIPCLSFPLDGQNKIFEMSTCTFFTIFGQFIDQAFNGVLEKIVAALELIKRVSIFSVVILLQDPFFPPHFGLSLFQ